MISGKPLKTITFSVDPLLRENILNIFEGSGLFVLQEKIPSYIYYNDRETAVWLSEGIFQAALLWSTYEVQRICRTKRSIFYFTLPWYLSKERAQKTADKLKLILPEEVFLENLIILCNSEEEVMNAREVGFKESFLCSHNAWLDWDKYNIIECEKIYDHVINTRPERWKRPFFASSVENLAIIKGTNHRKSDFFDLNSLSPAYINDQRISPEEVNKILNLSFTGGIYSLEEGGCYSSSEYLLCGLPVVSTISKGGRDTWFNDYNSIVVEGNDTLAIKRSVELLKSRILSGEIIPEVVRQQHIEKQKEMRESFVLDFSNRIYCSVEEAREYFSKTYQNKLVRYNVFLEI